VNASKPFMTTDTNVDVLSVTQEIIATCSATAEAVNAIDSAK